MPEPGGVTFVMTDLSAGDIVCVVEAAALEAARLECGLEKVDQGTIFLKLRPEIEACASDKYDAAGGPVVVVKSSDLLA